MRSATEAEIVNFEARELEMCLLKCRAQAEVLARSSAASLRSGTPRDAEGARFAGRNSESG
jgi:hypothetical protein